MKVLSDLLERWEVEMSKTAAPFPSAKPEQDQQKKNENENNLKHIGVNRLIHSGS